MLRKNIERGGMPEGVKKTECGGGGGGCENNLRGGGMPEREKKTKCGGGHHKKNLGGGGVAENYVFLRGVSDIKWNSPL